MYGGKSSFDEVIQSLIGGKLIGEKKRKIGSSKHRLFQGICCKEEQRHGAVTGGDRGSGEGLRDAWVAQ